MSFVTANPYLENSSNEKDMRSVKITSILLVGALLIGTSTFAQKACKEYKWAISDESQTLFNSRDAGIASDGSNILACGTFSSSTFSMGTNSVNNTGGSDAYLIKLSDDGTDVWVINPTGTMDERGRDVATDAAGNYYLLGDSNSDTVDFGSGAIAVNTGTDRDVFVAKYSTAGAIMWAIGGVGDRDDEAYDMNVDGSNNTYLVGSYMSTNFNLPGTGNISNSWPTFPDPFIAKVDASGTPQWVAGPSGSGGGRFDVATGVATDASGNVYVCGYFDSDMLIFGGGTDTIHNSGATMTRDVWVAKYDASGVFQWARGGGGNDTDFAVDLDVDASGNVYVTGQFAQFSATFSGTTLTNTDMNFDDMFLLSYDGSGALNWAVNPAGNNAENPFACAVGTDGNIHVTGFFNSSTLTFGGTQLSNTNPGGDMFWAQYDNTGSAICARGTDGDTKSDFGYGVTTDDSGRIYVTGIFQSGNISFGTTLLNNTDTLGAIFITQIGDTTGTPPSFISNRVQNEVHIYPNPTQGRIQINIAGVADLKVEVYNVFGQLVEALPGRSGMQLDMSHMNPGVYLVKVHSQKGIMTKRVILSASGS
jgi:hypothetical protein